MLGQIADAFAHLERIVEDIEPRDFHRSAGCRQEPGDNAHRRGLAGTIGAEKAQDLPGRHAERDIGDRGQVTVAFGEMLDFDHEVRMRLQVVVY